MEMIHTGADIRILPFDTEVLNLRLHESVLQESLKGAGERQEFVVLGLSKGAVLLFNAKQLSQLYCRFTVHREKIKAVKYLKNTNCFLSICKEGYLMFWQLGKDRKVNKLRNFRLPPDKQVSKVHVVVPEYRKEFEGVPQDRFMLIFKSGESEMFDFELNPDVVLQEGELEPALHAHLYLVENEKQKEHDSKVTGVDSSKFVRLIVTSDRGGSVKFWSLDKRFMREITFPHSIDSVCFLNQHGDILISHVQRISKIRFEKYWTSSFTHFGFTQTTDPVHLRYLENEATLETEIFDSHVCVKPPPGRTRITSEEHFFALFRNKTEEEVTMVPN